jgi:hypothetical protein
MLYLHVTAIMYTEQARIKQEKEWTWRNIVMLKLIKKRGRKIRKCEMKSWACGIKMFERHAVLYWKRLLEKRKEDYLKEKRRLFERKE